MSMRDVFRYRQPPLWILVAGYVAAVLTAAALFVYFYVSQAYAQVPPEPEPGGALVSHEWTERVGFVGDERTTNWTQSGSTPDWNQLRVYQVETDALLLEDNEIPGDATSYKWTPTRAGHYRLEMEACLADDPDTATPNDTWCTATSDSRDQQYTGDNYPRGWVIYVKLKPPSDGGIE